MGKRARQQSAASVGADLRAREGQLARLNEEVDNLTDFIATGGARGGAGTERIRQKLDDRVGQLALVTSEVARLHSLLHSPVDGEAVDRVSARVLRVGELLLAEPGTARHALVLLLQGGSFRLTADPLGAAVYMATAELVPLAVTLDPDALKGPENSTAAEGDQGGGAITETTFAGTGFEPMTFGL